MTSDSPSGYLVESEIAMLGRLGRAGTRRARVLGRILAIVLLVSFSMPILLSALVIFLL